MSAYILKLATTPMKLRFKSLSLILLTLSLFTGCATQTLSQDKGRVKLLGNRGKTETPTRNVDEIISSSPLDSAQTNQLPTPSLPQSLPKPRYHGDLDWLDKGAIKDIERETDLSLGIGHLRPKDLSPFTIDGWEDPNSLVGTGWLGKVTLPLYQQPEGQHWGWLAQGWLLRPSGEATNTFSTDSRPFTVANIVYKGTVNSFVVLKIRDDGWFKLRYAQPTSEDDGTAWAHQSHLNLGEIALTVEPWEKWFSQLKKPFYFRDEARHALRKEPTNTSEIVAWLPGKQDAWFVPQEVKGDWMRVLVSNDACDLNSASTTNPKCQAGWVRWQNSEQVPLVWYGEF